MIADAGMTAVIAIPGAGPVELGGQPGSPAAGIT
jgi:hypothetical protein